MQNVLKSAMLFISHPQEITLETTRDLHHTGPSSLKHCEIVTLGSVWERIMGWVKLSTLVMRLKLRYVNDISWVHYAVYNKSTLTFGYACKRRPPWWKSWPTHQPPSAGFMLHLTSSFAPIIITAATRGRRLKNKHKYGSLGAICIIYVRVYREDELDTKLEDHCSLKQLTV